MAATMRRARMLDFLLSVGANIEKADRGGLTPLLICARHASEECVRSLLNAGADLGKTDNDGLAALHYAAQGIDPASEVMREYLRRAGSELSSSEERCEVIRQLIQAGMDANIRDRIEKTPLMLASDLAVVRTLLENGGALPNAVDLYGNAVIHHAALMGRNSSVICMLYKAGANPLLLNRWRLTPADVARVRTPWHGTVIGDACD